MMSKRMGFVQSCGVTIHQLRQRQTAAIVARCSQKVHMRQQLRKNSTSRLSQQTLADNIRLRYVYIYIYMTITPIHENEAQSGMYHVEQPTTRPTLCFDLSNLTMRKAVFFKSKNSIKCTSSNTIVDGVCMHFIPTNLPRAHSCTTSPILS